MARRKSLDLKTMSKEDIIKAVGISPNDTGSPEVQIALFSKRILELAEHCKLHKKDNASRRGLLQLIGKRRRFLEYLRRKSPERYQNIIELIGISK